VVPLGGGCSNHPNQVLGVVGGVMDDPLLSGDPLPSISPTPVVPSTALMAVTAAWYLWMEATAIVPVRSLTLLLVVVRMIHFLVVIPLLYLSHPSRSSNSLGGGDSVVVPLDGGCGDRPSLVLDLVAGGDGDELGCSCLCSAWCPLERVSAEVSLRSFSS
jgi:hypothetical protein